MSSLSAEVRNDATNDDLLSAPEQSSGRQLPTLRSSDLWFLHDAGIGRIPVP